ncbi:MAG: NYN domain-containing protein [Phycisphaerae bacterium]
MPVLIDGYNLYFYAKSLFGEEDIDLSVAMFCRIIDEWVGRTGQDVRIIFDGNVPPTLRQNQKHFGRVAIEFTSRNSDADTVIESYIGINTAPKRLTIVSSDLRIRKAAIRRKCKVVKSDEFWAKVAKKLSREKIKPEPREKTVGIFSHEREFWLNIFGYK